MLPTNKIKDDHLALIRKLDSMVTFILYEQSLQS